MKSQFLRIEATLCSAPCVLLAIGGLPVILMGAFRNLGSDTFEGVKSILFAFGLIFPFFEYGKLSLQTAAGKRYRFGFMFWSALMLALIDIWWIGLFFGFGLAALAISPILVATVHFLEIQIRSRSEMAPAAK